MSDDTFSAADFESAASSSEPVASTPTESSAPADATAPPEAATTQPADATAVSTSTEAPKPAGPIPFDVHKTALDNARTKAVEDYRQQYGWAEQVNQNDLQEAIKIAQLAQRDPIAYMQEFIKDLQGHPQYSAQLRSLAAKALAQRSQPVENAEPQPDLPIQLEDGRVVHLYSAEQQAKREAFLQRQWLSQVKQEFAPLVQTHEHLQADRAALAQQQEITRYVTTTYQDVQTWPGMEVEANRVAVANELARAQVTSDDPREVSLALNAAYRKTVLPTLQRTERQTVLDTIKHQANASTVNPAQSSTRSPKSMDDMSIAEALQHVAGQQA